MPVDWQLAGPGTALIVSDAEAEILFVGVKFLDAAAIRDQLTSVWQAVVSDRDYPT